MPKDSHSHTWTCTVKHLQIRTCLLDLSSPVSSQSVMFLSSTGLGGLEKRLTKAMMVGNATGPSPQPELGASVTRWLKVLIYWQSGEKLTVYTSQQHMRRLTDIISGLMFNAVSTQLWYPQLCLCPRRFHRWPGARLQTQNIVFIIEGFFGIFHSHGGANTFVKMAARILQQLVVPPSLCSEPITGLSAVEKLHCLALLLVEALAPKCEGNFLLIYWLLKMPIILLSAYMLVWRTIYILMFMTLVTVLFLSFYLINNSFSKVFQYT